MLVEIEKYQSAEKIAEKLDNEIAQTKSVLGKYLRRLDEIRILAAKFEKIHKVVMELASEKIPAETLCEMTVGSIDVVLDANPAHEFAALESVVQSHQDHLLVLQEAREALRWMDQIGETEGLECQVLENEGVPECVLFKISKPKITHSPPSATEVAKKRDKT
jgi:signal-transduction protein with cAMP-binding, CBS, and nucleotidyltransferase domain